MYVTGMKAVNREDRPQLVERWYNFGAFVVPKTSATSSISIEASYERGAMQRCEYSWDIMGCPFGSTRPSHPWFTKLL